MNDGIDPFVEVSVKLDERRLKAQDGTVTDLIWKVSNEPIPADGHRLLTVESGCGAVTLGRACLLPPLSSGGALVARP
jgi:hypothetical protein